MSKSVVPSIIIRSYKPSDLSACKAMLLDSHKEYGDHTEYFEHAFLTDMADIEKNYLQVPSAHWWVAVSTEDDRIVGQVAVQPLRLGSPIYYEVVPAEERDQICELRRMSVISDAQKRGIGARLLTTLLDFARQHGYRQVHLTTLTNMRKACDFYERNGFVKGQTDRFFIDEAMLKGVKQDEVHRRKLSVTFKPGDTVPEEDQRRMKLPVKSSEFFYVQHYFLLL